MGYIINLIGRSAMPYVMAAIVAIFATGGGVWWYKAKTTKHYNKGMDTMFSGYVGVARKEQRRLDRERDNQSAETRKNYLKSLNEQNKIKLKYGVKR